MLTLFVLAALSQSPDAEPTPKPTTGDAPTTTGRGRSGDEAQKAARKAQALPPEARATALEEVQRQFGGSDINPVVPPSGWDMDRFMDLPAADQARVVARRFFEDLIAGDGRGLVAAAGLPFHLEDRRLERVEDLRSEWVRILRSRRTDLLKLYSVEILTLAEMEKKHGRAPQRLSRWELRGPNTFLAVGNLSGHAAVLLLRPVGVTWQVLAYSD
jgi:hypothetical protein